MTQLINYIITFPLDLAFAIWLIVGAVIFPFTEKIKPSFPELSPLDTLQSQLLFRVVWCATWPITIVYAIPVLITCLSAALTSPFVLTGLMIQFAIHFIIKKLFLKPM